MKTTIDDEARYPYRMELAESVLVEVKRDIYRLVPEVTEWLITQCDQLYRVKYPGVLYTGDGYARGTGYIWFMSKDDAVRFKLRWA